jgi:CTP:molybdopterin cytidylyltransferase MocA
MLRDAFEAAPQEVWAVAPDFGGKHGHPYVVGRELIEVFLQAPPTASARDLQRLHQEHVQYVVVDDPFVAMNINTPEDYAGLAADK